MAIPKLVTGARAIIRMNGEPMVFGTDVSYSIDTEYKPLREIDSSLPAELTPGQISVQVTVSGLRAPFGSPTMMRLQPTVGNILTQPYASIEIRDRGTDAVLLYVHKAMLTRRTGRIASRAIASETWTWVGILWWDEVPPTDPKLGP